MQHNIATTGTVAELMVTSQHGKSSKQQREHVHQFNSLMTALILVPTATIETWLTYKPEKETEKETVHLYRDVHTKKFVKLPSSNVKDCFDVELVRCAENDSFEFYDTATLTKKLKLPSHG